MHEAPSTAEDDEGHEETVVPGVSVDARVARLEAELAAARRTIDVLVRRVERPSAGLSPDRFALQRVIASLESTVIARTRALEDSEAHYRILFENSPDAILTLDRQCHILTCNGTAERAFGRSRSELAGAPISALLDPSSGAALIGLLWAGHTGVGDSDVGLPDGRRMSFSVTHLDADHLLLVFRNVTQAHRLENELIQARRLISAGRLAARLAHDINTPLSVLLGRLELLEATPQSEGTLRQLGVMKDHCGRIAGLVRNLQTFALQSPPRRQWLVMHEELQRTLTSIGRRLDRVKIKLEIEPHDLRIHADRAQLAQLLSNLLCHAAEMSPAGAVVRVRATDAGSGGACLVVEDSGTNLNATVLSQLQAPDIDSRQPDPSLGLSIAIAWTIAQDHGGRLTAEPRRPSGTAYRCVIPSGEGPVPELPREGERRPRSILIVDDDELLCETVLLMLSGEGNRIEAVHSAEEALVSLKRRSFDVVLTDIRLPGMDGEALADRIEAWWPELSSRTILCSGAVLHPRRSNPYLQKPFTGDQLRGLIQRISTPTCPR